MDCSHQPSLVTHSRSRLSLLFLLLQCIIYPISSQTAAPTSAPTTATDTDEEEGQYTEIYLTMIIIFAILFVVVIFCLIYRIYKKRQEENADSERTGNDKKAKQTANKKNGKQSKTKDAPKDNDAMALPAEQVKFRGSMSSVEHRHERVPSKPVVIQITTPKGTRHVADMFGKDGEEEGADNKEAHGQIEPDLPEIDETQEDEYNAQRRQKQEAADTNSAQQASTQSNNEDVNIANGNDDHSAES